MQSFLAEKASTGALQAGVPTSHYDHFLLRRNSAVGDEIFGPKTIQIGTYSETELYGAAGSPSSRFRAAIQALADNARRVSGLDPETLEFSHRITLLWADMGRLKEFIGTTPIITEIVSELRTARFQFLARDTPREMVMALANALKLLVEARRMDTGLVDRFVETLEQGGFDSLAFDILRPADA